MNPLNNIFIIVYFEYFYFLTCLLIFSFLYLTSEYELSTADGTKFKLSREMVTSKTFNKVVHVEEITPSVVEPSFGIGRIMYAVLEHNFMTREADEQRNVRSIFNCYNINIKYVALVYYFDNH